MFRSSARHEVEGYAERVDVRVVGVIDECEVTLPLLDFQTHGNGLKVFHLLCDFCVVVAEADGCGQTGNAVLDGGVVNKGNGIGAAVLACNGVGNGRIMIIGCDVGNVELSCVVPV